MGNNINPNTGEAVEIENVKFLGEMPQEEAENWMRRASIFISPTKYEPFGLAILEAAAAGCALVLNKLDTLTELWHDVAIFFDPENKRETKELVLQLIENEEFREEVGQKARKRAEHFSAEKMAVSYMELYKDLLNKKKPENQLIQSI
ncbi:glycosyltransferase family 4 protein [Antarcticibacterium sp. 1MA-6-2]|uniref:glycosyltransferase family 4 protein n=1 Tax=Antarcticibacterium sp. 1MA-6-2 TaxID=2908210 RepID=UPI001F1F6172|nr:glycosyltransferase family 4 protein [Antarcticibacterium sp. 1MA-6-2]UJH90484.1 glycosyltransferase family 4 protein [Antarcticibacterium sp. 1MA-6-2]